MGDNEASDEPTEVVDCTGVSVVVKIALNDSRAERVKLAIALEDFEVSGERELAAELVALIDEATDLEADAERDDNKDNEGDGDIALLTVLFKEVVAFILVRADTDEVTD